MLEGETCWTLVRGAAAGNTADRDRFASLYLPVVRGYLRARWHGRPSMASLDDASQQVFVECLRHEGALERALVRAERGFRAFLYGVVANVARRFESPGAQRQADDPLALCLAVAKDDPVSHVFDRAWASALVREAAILQAQQATLAGERAELRVQLLRERFAGDRPIREIADEWGMDAAKLHHEYATARNEFHSALRGVIRAHNGSSADAVELELKRVLEDLGQRG